LLTGTSFGLRQTPRYAYIGCLPWFFVRGDQSSWRWQYTTEPYLSSISLCKKGSRVSSPEWKDIEGTKFKIIGENFDDWHLVWPTADTKVFLHWLLTLVPCMRWQYTTELYLSSISHCKNRSWVSSPEWKDIEGSKFKNFGENVYDWHLIWPMTDPKVCFHRLLTLVPWTRWQYNTEPYLPIKSLCKKIPG
jgi:hypothetical protein